jgi:uncharacterized membrane protein YfcA
MIADVLALLAFDARVAAVTTAMVVVAGLIRGFTGFGATMVLAPSLSFVMPPPEAVALALILELAGAAQLAPRSVGAVDWRRLAPLTATACLAAPVGSFALVFLDPEIARRMIGGTVTACVLVMLSGWRFRGHPGPASAIPVGALGGTLLGSTGVGGPPVVIYLMSTPDPAATTRANIIVHIGLTTLVLLAILAAHGTIDAVALWRAAAMLPLHLAANAVGARMFRVADERLFRRAALLFLAGTGAVALFG